MVKRRVNELQNDLVARVPLAFDTRLKDLARIFT